MSPLPGPTAEADTESDAEPDGGEEEAEGEGLDFEDGGSGGEMCEDVFEGIGEGLDGGEVHFIDHLLENGDEAEGADETKGRFDEDDGAELGLLAEDVPALDGGAPEAGGFPGGGGSGGAGGEIGGDVVDEPGGDDEAEGVDDETAVGAEDGDEEGGKESADEVGDDADEGDEGVGGDEFVGADDLGKGGLAGGDEEAVEGAHEEDDDVDGAEVVELEPEVDNGEGEEGANEVGPDHDQAAGEVVDDPAVEGGEEKPREHGAEGDTGGVFAYIDTAFDAEDDGEEGPLVEAVAEGADDLAVPEAGEVLFAQDGAKGDGGRVGGHAVGR